MNKPGLQSGFALLLVAGAAVQADQGVYVLPYGQVVDQSGNIVSEGNMVAGQRGDSLEGTDGKIYSANDLRVDNRGKLVTKDGRAFEARKREPTPDFASQFGPDARVIKRTQSSSNAGARTRGEQAGSRSVAASGGSYYSSSATGDGSASATGANRSGKESTGAGSRPARHYSGPGVEMVIGGNSENGVARIGKLPILP